MLHSVLSNWVAFVIMGVTSFLLTPLLIHHLGDFHYGMWVLVGSLLDYYDILDLGIRTTLHRFVGLFSGTRDREGLNGTIATAMAISFTISLFVAASSVVVIIAAADAFALEPTTRSLFRWLVAVLALSMAALFPARALGAYLCGLQRFDLYNLGVVATVLVRAAAIVLLLRWGFEVLAVAVVALGTAFLSLVMNWMLVRWADPGVSLDWRHASWRRLHELASFGFYAFLSRLGDSLRCFTDPLVIGRALSIDLITPFSVSARLMNHFKTAVMGLVGPLMPRMSELEGGSRLAELRELFLQGSRASALLSLFIGSILLLDGQALLQLWLGERFVSTYPLLLILTAAYVVSLAQYPSTIVIYARGRHRPLGWWTLAEGVANVLLSIYWARRYGLIGVALGTTVSMLFVGLLVQPWYALRLVGVSVGRYVRQALAPPVLTCALFLALGSWAASGWAQVSLGHFLLALGWQGALFGALAYVLALGESERRIVMQWCQRCAGFALRIARTQEAQSMAKVPSRSVQDRQALQPDGRMRVLHIEVGGSYGGSLRGLEVYLAHTDHNRFEHDLLLYYPTPGAERATPLVRRLWTLHDRAPAIPRPRLVRRATRRLLPATARSLVQEVTAWCRLLRDLPKARALARAIRAGNYDVIHVNNTFTYQAPSLLAAGWAKRPVVAHVRNPLLRGPFTRWTMRLATAVITINRSLETELRSWGVPVKVGTCYECVEVPVPDRCVVSTLRASLVPPDGILIGAAGRLDAQKGFDTLVRAARRIVDINPEMRFAIAGEGPLRPALEGLIAELGLTEHFHLCGFRPDVANFLSALDLFVCSSLWEGGPIVVVEAMLLGTPVITTPVGIVPELFNPERRGYLVPPADPVALAEAISAALDQRAIAIAMAEAGRRAAVALNDPRLNAGAFDGMVAEIVAASRGATIPMARGRRPL